MIPSDFRDFFITSSTIIQQEIVSSLLSLSLQESEVTDTNESKAVTCPHCQDNRIRANWNYYIALDTNLRDLELDKLTLNYEKKKQNLQCLI